jgi:hypothetical protein
MFSVLAIRNRASALSAGRKAVPNAPEARHSTRETTSHARITAPAPLLLLCLVFLFGEGSARGGCFGFGARASASSSHPVVYFEALARTGALGGSQPDTPAPKQACRGPQCSRSSHRHASPVEPKRIHRFPQCIVPNSEEERDLPHACWLGPDECEIATRLHSCELDRPPR